MFHHFLLMAPVMTPAGESNWDTTRIFVAMCLDGLDVQLQHGRAAVWNSTTKANQIRRWSEVYRSKTLKCMNFNRSLQPLLHLKIPHVALKTTCLTWHDQCTAMIQWHCVTVDLFLQNRNPKQLKHRSIQFHSKCENHFQTSTCTTQSTWVNYLCVNCSAILISNNFQKCIVAHMCDFVVFRVFVFFVCWKNAPRPCLIFWHLVRLCTTWLLNAIFA